MLINTINFYRFGLKINNKWKRKKHVNLSPDFSYKCVVF